MVGEPNVPYLRRRLVVGSPHHNVIGELPWLNEDGVQAPINTKEVM